MIFQKSKLVLVGPDGFVTPHGAQLPINTAGYIIRTIVSLIFYQRALSSFHYQTLQFTMPVQRLLQQPTATPSTAKLGPSSDVRLTSFNKTGASSTTT